MKILFIGYTTYDNSRKISGGTEFVNDKLLRYLTKDNEIVYYVTQRASRSLLDTYAADYGCKVVEDNIFEVLSSFKPDLIFTSMCNSSDDPIFSRINNSGVPVCVYVHTSLPDTVEGYTLSPTTYYTYLSPRMGRILETKGVSASNIYHIFNPINYEDLSVVNTPSRYDIITNARIVKQKGVDNSVRLACKFNYRMGMIGSVSSLCYRLRDKYLGQLGPLGSYLGVLPHTEVCDVVRNSRLFGFLVNGPEGFGLAPLEAMALGTPVITWRGDDLPGISDSAYNILLDKGDFLKEFEEVYLPRLDEYLDYSRRIQMSLEVRQKYNEAEYYKKIQSILEDIMRRSHGN